MTSQAVPEVAPPDTLPPADVARFGADPRGTFVANLTTLEARITAACQRAGRTRASIRLLPITKTVPAHVLRHAWAAGITRFGENKVQEAMTKQKNLSDLPIDWSIVGHLQTNKAKSVARLASEFHALDSLRLAETLNRHLEQESRVLTVYIQVNTSGESSKFGIHPNELPCFIENLYRFPNLRPRGLMTLAIFDADPGRVRSCFTLLRRLRDQAAALHPAVAELSMGMSGDFEVAIAEGADVIRVGQAIFGCRPTPDGTYWPGF